MFPTRDGVRWTGVLLVLESSFIGPFYVCRGQVVLVGPASDPFEDSADFLQAMDQEIYGSFINGNQIQMMIDLFMERTSCQDMVGEDTCYKCSSLERLIPFLELNGTVVEGPVMRNVQELGRASLVLIYMELELNITSDCNSSSDGVNSTKYEDILEAVCQFGSEGDTNITKRCESFTLQQLDWVVEQINATYQPISKYECFTAESLFEEAGIPTNTADRSELEVLFAYLLHHILQGHCIGLSELVQPSFFVDDIFITYGNADSVVTMEDFIKLLKDIGIYGRHRVEEVETQPTQGPVESQPTQGPDIPVSMTTQSLNVVTTLPTLNVTMTTGNVTDNSTVLPINATTVLPNMTTSPPIRHGGNRPARSVNERADKHDITKRDLHLEADYVDNKCFSAEEIFAIFGIDPEMGAERGDFVRLCPALIQQLSIEACHEVHREKTPIADVYLWGTLAVLVISLCSLLAVLIIPCSGSCIFNTLMHFLIALAASTLSGDALFHLLPEAMGLNAHGTTSRISLGHDNFIYKLMTTLVSIYLCFLFEKIFKMLSKNTEEPGPPELDENALNGFATEGAMNTSPNNQNGSQEGAMNTSLNNQNGSQNTKSMDQLLMEPLKGEKSTCSSCKGLNSSSMIVLFGDSVHNFMDGLAIGVAFTADFYVGVSTSVAVICHEVPHELGDFAVLLRNGMTKKMALFCNFVSALFAFLGLYVGISLALSEAFHSWIFAVTTGMFLYISLVDLTNTLLEVPPHTFGRSRETDVNPLDEMDYQGDSDERAGNDGCSCPVFVFQNVGLFLGWTLMLMLALYEDQLVHLF